MQALVQLHISGVGGCGEGRIWKLTQIFLVKQKEGLFARSSNSLIRGGGGVLKSLSTKATYKNSPNFDFFVRGGVG